MTNLDPARALAEKGFHVLPLNHPRALDGACSCPRGEDCDSPGKHPLISDWRDQSTTDPDTVNLWWSKWPRANIGIDTGKSDLFVVDVDPGKGGEESLNRLMDLTDESEWDTLRSKTGSGGLHFYFKGQTGLRNTAGRLGPGIDTRAVGGYVVAPPSIIPAGDYAWARGQEGGEGEILPIPDGVLQMLEARDAMGSEVDLSKPVKSGGRNTALASLAGTLRRKGMPGRVIEQSLLSANAEVCHPPLTDAEVRDIAESIGRYEPTDPLPEFEGHIPGGVRIRDVTDAYLGKPLTVEGVVQQVGEKTLVDLDANYDCRKCGADVHYAVPPKNDPTKCPECNQSHALVPAPHRNDTQTRQRILIQEPPEGLSGGRQPESLKATLEGHLVGSVKCGDRVKATGRLDRWQPKKVGASMESQRMLNVTEVEQVVVDYSHIHVTEEDVQAFKEFAAGGDVLRRLRRRLAPGIHGMTTVKDALTLSIFGGVVKEIPGVGHRRGDIHVLLVGEAGVAKSKLLRRVKAIAPRCVLVGGRGTSGVGLTASVVKSEVDGGWVVAAGAMVLAHNGTCAIDEFDKMKDEDRQNAHEAMEDQCYSWGTPALLSDGRRVKLGPFVDSLMDERAPSEGVDCQILSTPGLAVPSVDMETGRTCIAEVDRVSRHIAPDEMVEVQYSNGRSIQVTPDHPVFVSRGPRISEVAASGVKVGDFCPAPPRIELSADGTLQRVSIGHLSEIAHPTPQHMSPDLAEMCGLIITDGNFHPGRSKTITFHNKDVDYLERYRRLAVENFGVAPGEYVASSGVTTLRIVSSYLYRWFQENLGEMVATGVDKRVPSKIMAADEDTLGAFMAGAFSGDGCVTGRTVKITCAGRGLAEDYQDCLMSLGVHSVIYPVEGAYSVVVRGWDHPKLAEILKPGDRKRVKLEASLAKGRSVRTPDMVPKWVPRYISEFRRRSRLGGRSELNQNEKNGFSLTPQRVEREADDLERRAVEIEASAGLTPLRRIIDEGPMSMLAMSEESGVPHWRLQYSSNGGYDDETRREIEGVVRESLVGLADDLRGAAGELRRAMAHRMVKVSAVRRVPYTHDWVYDMTVEPTHTFVGSGVALHNSVSINKAGINTTLKSVCSVIAAANPIGGRFDPEANTLAEITGIEPPLLSRFDLIFLLRDPKNRRRDEKLFDKIVRNNAVGEDNDIDDDWLRKYVAYAKTIDPQLPRDVAETWKEYFLDSRGDVEHFTPRQLESLIRLAEAHARARLSPVVSEEDAEAAMDIHRRYIHENAIDEEGHPDLGQFEGSGKTKSQEDRMVLVRKVIKDCCSASDDGMTDDESVVAELEAKGLTGKQAWQTLRMTKRNGEVYTPGEPGRYKPLFGEVSA